MQRPRAIERVARESRAFVFVTRARQRDQPAEHDVFRQIGGTRLHVAAARDVCEIGEPVDLMPVDDLLQLDSAFVEGGALAGEPGADHLFGNVEGEKILHAR